MMGQDFLVSTSSGAAAEFDGYPSEAMRNAHCWNMKLLAYALILNLVCAVAFVFWQMSTPIICFAILPMIFNVWLLVQENEAIQRWMQHTHKAVFWVVYSVLGSISVIGFAFMIVFIVSLCGFSYDELGYYPSIGYGFSNLYLVCATLTTALYTLSFAWLIHTLRCHHTQGLSGK